MEHELIVCSCGDLEHQIILSTYDDDIFGADPYIYVSIGLRRDYDFVRRLYVAVKYLFGSVINSAYHTDVILDPANQKHIVNILSTKLAKIDNTEKE